MSVSLFRLIPVIVTELKETLANHSSIVFLVKYMTCTLVL